MKATSHFELRPQGPFSLKPLQKLQCGFLKGTRCDLDRDGASIAFPRDGSFDVVGVHLTREGDRILGDVSGARDGAEVGRQVARVLAVDHDGEAFARVLAKDPILKRVGQKRPGFRPVVSYSPYVMAGWCVLSQRLRMSQAAVIQVKVAEAAGDVAEIAGRRVPSFPRPRTFLERTGFPGVPEEKWTRLQAVAQAALEGWLEPERLAKLPYEEAREALMKIHGIGPWIAEGILVRGVGPTDVLPLGERALHGAVALAYGLDGVPTDAEVEEIAQAWRPYRTWVSVLLISEHFDEARRRTAVMKPARRARLARSA